MTTTSLQNTGAALGEAGTQNINNQPEWLRVAAACERFGVKRAWLYKQLADGKIKSTCLRNRGAVRGIRLISRDSLAAFIEAGATGGI